MKDGISKLEGNNLSLPGDPILEVTNQNDQEEAKVYEPDNQNASKIEFLQKEISTIKERFSE